MLHSLKISLPSFLIFVMVLAIYIVFAGRLKFDFPTEPANYFSYQTLAFFHGRLDIQNPSWEHDLSKFNDKLYMYWGPSPILFIFPFVLFFGINTSDVLYTAILGSFSPLIFYLILQKLEKLEIINLSTIKKFLLTLFFGVGTVYFSVSVRGGVWFTSQTVSTLFILFSIYFILDYLIRGKTKFLILSALFLGLAAWGRNTLILYLPLILSLIVIKKIQHHASFQKLIQEVIKFFIILGLVFGISIIYNFLRFGSFLETGYSYQEAAARFLEAKEQHGYISFFYLPHNFDATILSFPSFKNEYPFFDFNGEGNSFILLSPLFLLTIFSVHKKFWRTKTLQILNTTIILSILGIIFFQLLFWGTGWFQFSARYMLDAVPLLLLLLAQVLSKSPTILVIILTLFSIVINTLGAMWLSNIKI